MSLPPSQPPTTSSGTPADSSVPSQAAQQYSQAPTLPSCFTAIPPGTLLNFNGGPPDPFAQAPTFPGAVGYIPPQTLLNFNGQTPGVPFGQSPFGAYMYGATPVTTPFGVASPSLYGYPGMQQAPPPADPSIVPDEDPIDDKAVAAANAARAAPQDGVVGALQLMTACEYEVVKTSTTSAALCMASVLAPTAKQSSDRVPLDLVAVLDISGSMQGAKIDMLRQTMLFVVSQLTSADRLGLIPFDHAASYATPMTRCDEAGKVKLTQAINTRLNAEGGTNIANGMAYAGRMLRARRQTNAVTSVLLLTDGQDGSALASLPNIISEYPPGVTAHTFGFGADHDVAVMTKISEMAHGIYSYIERTDMVGDAFAGCLGGLLSVFAQQISLQITTHPEASIVSVRTHYTHRIAPDGKSAVIELGDIYSEESRDLLFQIEAPEVGDDVTSTLLFTAELTYVRTGETAATTNASSLTVARGAATQASGHLKLDQQRCRITTTEAMKEAVTLADAGRLDEARAKLTAAREQVSASASAKAGDALVRTLLADIDASAERMRDRGVYAAGGAAYAHNNLMQHQMQRAQAFGFASQAFGAAPAPAAYANSSAQAMQFAYHS